MPVVRRRKIAVVGNGDIPDIPGLPGMIDAADLVIRFNDCRSIGRGGRKTDIVALCNTGRPGKWMSEAPEWRESQPVRDACALWSVRDPQKFAALRPLLAVSHPELDDFCDDYSEAFAAIARQGGKVHRIIPQTVHEAVDAALAAHNPGLYVVPSSGLIAIAYILASEDFIDDEICLAGFGHQGWEGHPFAAEKRLVDTYVADGRLVRFSETSLLCPCEGA